jgi:MscS family membrane protein
LKKEAIVTLHKNCDRNGRRLRFARIYCRDIFLAVLALLVSAYSPAQLPTSPAGQPTKAAPTTPVDLLGRETPRGAFLGFLRYSEGQDYETAARYLQPPPHQNSDMAHLAREFQALQGNFEGDIELLSDDPNGTIQPGLPPGQVLAGALVVGGTTVDVILVRVDDPPSGKIWLISKETVAIVPKLYAQMESETPTFLDRIVPATLRSRRLFGMSEAKWLGWLLSIPISWLLAWSAVVLSSAPAWIARKLRKRPLRPFWKTQVGLPLQCIVAVVIHGVFVYLLALPLLYRFYYSRFLAALLVGCFLWFASKITDRGYEHVVNRMRADKNGGDAIIILMQRLSRIVLTIVGLVAALAIFGLNVKTTLAGLGIGGLAIALAAQKTLENLIGGVSLLMDKAVRIGDSCQIGDQQGTVEDIGLRSLKLRTQDQNLSVIPNGSLAQMQFQNMARRSKLLINQTFLLRIETRAEELRFVLDRVQSMLDQHPAIERETLRVRIMSFAGAAFQAELFAYVKTGDWLEFTAIRQQVILNIAEIVEASGTGFAGPTQLAYLSKDKGIVAQRANDGVPSINRAQDGDGFRFPSETRTGTD